MTDQSGDQYRVPPAHMLSRSQPQAYQGQLAPQPPYPPQGGPQQAPAPQPQPIRGHSRIGLTAAEKFWYVLMCIGFGAGYFAKIPSKKAMSDFGLCELTSAEAFWYILMCIAFGGGYFAKIPTAKALSELEQFRRGDLTRLESRHS
jgi:hypothetical protein